MQNNNDLVSICIPTYNNGPYIGAMLQSIIRQTYRNIEIIVSDNTSTDNTANIVKSIQDNRIRYCKNIENIGAANNFNQCIRLAKGELIAIYHSDDMYDPQIVEKEKNLLMSDHAVGAVFSLDTLINENDAVVGDGVSLPKYMRDHSVYEFNEIYPALLNEPSNFLICPTFMVKKRVFDTVGMFNVAGKYGDWVGGAGDTELWLRIAEKFKIGILNERLILRRIALSSGSGQYVSTYTSRSNHFLVLDSFLDSKALNAPIGECVRRQYDFNKFWDDVLIVQNMIKRCALKDARDLLLRIFSFSRFWQSIKTLSNLRKTITYYILLLALFMGLSKRVIALLEYTKRSKLNG